MWDPNLGQVMFTIGEFATIARVSVRMLRHYDAIGLLVPARVDAMGTDDVVVRPVGPARIAAVTGRVASADSGDVGPAVGALHAELGRHIDRGAVVPSGPAVAAYSPAEDGGLDCRAGITVADAAVPDGVELVELPGLDAAATVVHHGAMATIAGTYQRLAVWIEENGYRTDGTAREVYLVSMPEPQENWVTEIQMPVAAR